MKPRYTRQFRLAHDLGIDVYFHSCGNIELIIGDLIEAGIDFLNLSQPNVYDLRRIAKNFAGKVCFVLPVSYQTTSLTGSEEEIQQFAEEMYQLFWHNGGLVGYVESYGSIGLSEERYKWCVEAFSSLR